MKYALIELPDDFEKGCCQDCPLSYTVWIDDDGYTDCQDICVLNSRYDECPLDIRAEKIPFDFELYEAGLMDMPKETVKVLDNIKGYIDHIRNTGMGKKKSLEFIEKFIDGLGREDKELENPFNDCRFGG